MPTAQIVQRAIARGALGDADALALVEAAPEFAARRTDEVRFGAPHGDTSVLVTPLPEVLVAEVLSALAGSLPECDALVAQYPIGQRASEMARGRHARHVRELLKLVSAFDNGVLAPSLLAVVHSSTGKAGVLFRSRPTRLFFEHPVVVHAAAKLDATFKPRTVYQSKGDARTPAQLLPQALYVGRTLRTHALALGIIAEQQRDQRHVVAVLNYHTDHLRTIPRHVDAPKLFAGQQQLRLLVAALNGEVEALRAASEVEALRITGSDNATAPTLVATLESYALAYTQYATVDLLHSAYAAIDTPSLIVVVHDLPHLHSLVMVFDMTFVGTQPLTSAQQQMQQLRDDAGSAAPETPADLAAPSASPSSGAVSSDEPSTSA